jgi:DNA polymerase I-like protein with 3'-5' exonuclease and polymerase domains
MILWLQSYYPSEQLQRGGYAAMFEVAQRKAKLLRVQMLSLNTLYGRIAEKKKDKNGKATKKLQLVSGGRDKILNALTGMIRKYKPHAIACQDMYTLWALTGDDTASLDKYRGSTFFVGGTPIVIFNKAHSYNWSIVKHGSWLLSHDLKKLKRWETKEVRNEPKFEWVLCATESRLAELQDCAAHSTLIAADIETANGFITCIGFSCLRDARVYNFVVPFFNPLAEGGVYWETPELEVAAWRTVKAVCANSVVKIYQNGAYDATYQLRFHIPAHQYLLDSMYMMNAVWSEAPKSLDFLASIFVDHYCYWKDDSKGVTDANDKVPVTEEKLMQYWQYNALDNYYTLLVSMALMQIVSKTPWALANYKMKFSLQVGPALAASMRGMHVNHWKLESKANENELASDTALEKLRIMSADPEFNPKSGPQLANLLYDVIGAKPITQQGRGRKDTSRSTDEKLLKLVQTQHPILSKIIQAVWDFKKPQNNVSKYGPLKQRENSAGKLIWNGLRLWNNSRLLYSISVTGTETDRASSNQHAFRCGTNAQNIPEEIRDAMEAPPGYIFVEFDYSQSDAFFVAGESGDEKYIETMRGVIAGLDSHLRHAAFFYDMTYEELEERHKKKDPFVSKNPTGIRPITKRIVHGKNFLMRGATLFMLMGVEQVTNGMLAMGWPAPKGHNDMVKWCQHQLDRFGQELYPDLEAWQKSLPVEIAKNGGLLTNVWGATRYFFGDWLKDKSVHREMAAQVGQGGTAGNVNRSLYEYWYVEKLDGPNCYFTTQTHDSLKFAIRVELVHEYAKKILTIMQKPVTIKSWTFHVPVEAKIGFSWGRGLQEYNPKQTVEDWKEHERKIRQGYVKKVA